MTNSQVHPQGWISLLIAPEYEERAKQMRAERDRQYGNIYAEAATDERWVNEHSLASTANAPRPHRIASSTRRGLGSPRASTKRSGYLS